MEAVILPIKDYEELKENDSIREHIDIYSIIKKRECVSINDAIPFEDIIKEYGLTDSEKEIK